MDRNYVDVGQPKDSHRIVIEVERVQSWAYAVYAYRMCLVSNRKVRFAREIFDGFWARRKAIARGRELNALYNPEPPVPCIAWSSEWRED